jgi:uncharacterized membrane protein YtjA (UPF0391 family)
LVFFLIAIVAGVLGFDGICAAATSIARILFFFLLVSFVTALFTGWRRRPPGSEAPGGYGRVKDAKVSWRFQRGCSTEDDGAECNVCGPHGGAHHMTPCRCERRFTEMTKSCP